jgi:DNA invertase Pin-like site-specific DNA recombinase
MNLTRCYLRASTDAQDATRARSAVEAFAADHGLTIAGWFIENESGAKLQRPELFRLLGDSKPGDILLIEQVDRLSRLSASDWLKLRSELDARQIRVVALDLPTSWQLASTSDEFTSRMFSAINGMLLDMLAAISRKDYDDRRRRAAQGIARAKAEGKYRGRPENVDRNAGIGAMLRGGASWSSIQKATGCSRATINKVARRSAMAAE